MDIRVLIVRLLLLGNLVWFLVSNHAWSLVISTWSPPRSLAWQKGSRLGSGLLGLLLQVGSLGLPVSARGTQLVGPEETSWWAALVLLLRFLSVWFRRIGGFFLTWLFVRTLSIQGGYLGFHSRFSARLFGLPPGCLCLIRVVGQVSGSAEGFGYL